MTVQQIIKEIKTMNPKDRARVIAFVHKLEADNPKKYADEKAFTAAVEHVMSHHAPLMKKLAE